MHSAALQLIATLKAPAILPFFQDKNDACAALDKLADVFLTRHEGASNHHKTALSSPITHASPCLTKNAPSPRAIDPPSPRAIAPPSPRVIALPSPRAIATPSSTVIVESAREKRARMRTERLQSKNISNDQSTLPSSSDPTPHQPAFIEPDAHLVNYLHQTNAVLSDSGLALEHRHLIKGPNSQLWEKALANDLGRLAQGVGSRMPNGTNAIFFIHPSSMPKNKKVTCVRLVSSIRPLKTEKHRVRATIGGDRLQYEGITSTTPAALATVKTHLNSTISTKNAKYLTLDIKDYYYGTPMDDYEHAQLPLPLIPPEIVKQYNLIDIAVNGRVYFEVRKGMPGLKQAGAIAHARLSEHLHKSGYECSRYVSSLWRHKSLPISFTLVVDDFGVKYVGKQAAQHLIETLQSKHVISIDWSGRNYLGFTLDWDYVEKHVTLSMPQHVIKALQRFQHLLNNKPTHSPALHVPPTYGAKIQHAPVEEPSDPLSAQDIKLIQEVVGTFLYYSRAMDNTMAVAINDLSQAQTKGTALTMKALTHLISYASTHPDAKIRHHASDMILHIHSDGSYLSLPKSRSRAGGYFFLSNCQDNPSKARLNGPIHIACTVIKNVMASAAETEIAATFINVQEAVPLRCALTFLYHPQPATPTQVDNTTAVGFTNKTIKQKRSKAIDMRFYWLQDRACQEQFKIYWHPGKHNMGDYFTKHFSPADHAAKRPLYLHMSAPVANCLLLLKTFAPCKMRKGVIRAPLAHSARGT